MKILAIDNNADNLNVLNALISDTFPKTAFISASSGRHGIELCQSEKPDVVLLDISLTDMGVHEVCQILKANDLSKTIPIIVLTSQGSTKEARERALEAGADAFLTKPLDQTELKAQINAMFRIKKSEVQFLNHKKLLDELVNERTEALQNELRERNQVLEALQDSEEKYSILFLNSPDSYLIIKDGVFIDCNKATEEMMGGDRSSIIGKTPASLSPEFQPDGKKSTESAEEKISYAFKYGKNTFEWMHRRFDGSDLYVEVSIAPMILKGVQTLFTTWRDISTRKMAENALKEKEIQFKEFFDKAADAIFIAELETGIIVDVNLSAAGLMQIPREQIIGLNQSQIHPKQKEDFSVQNFREHDKMTEQDLPMVPLENEIVRPDGSLVPVEVLASRVFYKDKKCLMGTFRDISERKKVETMLRESEYFFKESQRAAFIGSYQFDIANDYWSSSEVLEQILGIGPKMNKKLQDWINIILPEDREMMVKYFMEEVVGKKQPFNKEYRIFNQVIGEIRWVLGLGKLNFDADGNVIEMIGTIQDITERKMAEFERGESHEFTESLLKTIPFGMDIVDDEGTILFQSANFENVFTTKAIGRKCWELYCDENTQCIECPLITGIDIGKTDIYEASGILGGRVFEISHTGMIYKGKKAMLEIFQDITERKQTEQKLKESQQLFQGLFNASPDAIVLIDPHDPANSWPIVDCNEAACRMNGYTREELIGQSIDILNLTIGNPEERIEYLGRLKKTPVMQKETFHRHKDGHIMPIEVSTSVVTIGGKEMVLGIDRDITERKQTEQALYESESRYKSFISQISEGVYRFESDQPMDINLPLEEQIDFIYHHLFLAECNKAFLDMYGMSDEKEVIGKTQLDFHGGQNNLLNRSALREFIENGYRVENALTHEVNAHGQLVYFSNNALGIVEDNHLVRIWGTQADISEKTRADQIQQVLYTISNAAYSSTDLPELIKQISQELGKLLDSTNFYIAFYDEKTDMLSTIYETDEKDVISSWPAGKSITGYVIKQKKSLLATESKVMELCASGEVEIFGTPSKVWLGVPLFTDNKAAGALVVQSYDNPNAYTEKDLQILEFISNQISVSIERKKTEQELNLMGKAFNQSPVTIVITDKMGNIEYTNPKFSETTGYSSEEVKGKNPRILKSGLQTTEFYRNLWDTLNSGKDWSGEFQNRRKNNELYWESAVISPITNEYGETAFFMALKENITEKKKMIEDLIHARKEAEESDRLKSAFLANMSHEIRTPLNAIIGFSELIRDPAFEPEQQDEFAQLINDSGNNLLSILSDIMDISKIEAGQVSISKRKISVDKLITSIQKEFTKKADRKGIEIKIHRTSPGEVIEIETDETKIRQVIVNFLTNAIKFTEKGFIELGIDPQPNFVRLYVKDTGIGIPSAYHEKVFERFRQVETSHTRKYGGNGLGLCISKNLTELLGGTIGMESEEGKGSLFYIVIPRN